MSAVLNGAALSRASGTCARWQRLLESGEYASTTESPEQRRSTNPKCRVLRLTLLAPKVVEAIMERGQPERMAPTGLPGGLSVEWET